MRTYFLLLVFVCTFMTQVNAEDSFSYNSELDGFEYPFVVSTFEFSSQNQILKMRYMDVGDKNAEKIIVLLHGKNFSGYYWDRITNDFLKRNYRVIIPDQIGFGKSSKPQVYQYSFGQLGLNTKSLLDSLDITSYDIVGHSMGGVLAGDDWDIVAWNNALTYGPIFSENIVDRFPLIELEGLGHMPQFGEYDTFIEAFGSVLKD